MMFRLLVQHLFFLILRARNQLHPMSARKTNKKPSDNSSYADIVETMEVERVTASVDAISHESKSRFRGGTFLLFLAQHLLDFKFNHHFLNIVVKSGSRFKAEVIVNGVKHVLGEFDTEIEAAKSYDSYAKVRCFFMQLDRFFPLFVTNTFYYA